MSDIEILLQQFEQQKKTAERCGFGSDVWNYHDLIFELNYTGYGTMTEILMDEMRSCDKYPRCREILRDCIYEVFFGKAS